MARAEHTKPYKHQPSNTTYGQAADAIKRKPRCTIFRRASLEAQKDVDLLRCLLKNAKRE
jgi:hypothetical protein